jgi:hypothetical protein
MHAGRKNYRASLEDDGDELQNVAMERVARSKQGAKKKPIEEWIIPRYQMKFHEKTTNRSAASSAYKTDTRPQIAAPEAGPLEAIFAFVGALMM